MIAAAIPYAVSTAMLMRTYPLKPDHGRAGGMADRDEGKRLAKLYGCTSCHGAAFQGLRYNGDPSLVRNFAPNLTLLAARYSDTQLAQAIRQGVRPSDGRALWGMPSATFTTITDAEMGAVLAYLRSFPASGAPTPSDRPGIRARIAMIWGLLLPADQPNRDNTRHGTQQPAPDLVTIAMQRPPIDPGPAYRLGRHLARTICSECHGSDLGGDSVEGGPDLIIAGAYDLPAFRRLMRTGIPPGGRDLGIMRQTAREDLHVLTDREIDALHDYLVARAAAMP
nr:cytochrome c [Sphingomonas colocasiae]